jgi:hypothetical protein
VGCQQAGEKSESRQEKGSQEESGQEKSKKEGREEGLVVLCDSPIAVIAGLAV